VALENGRAITSFPSSLLLPATGNREHRTLENSLKEQKVSSHGPEFLVSSVGRARMRRKEVILVPARWIVFLSAVMSEE